MTDEMLKDAQCLFAFLAEAEEGPDRAEIVLAMGSQDLTVADTAVQAARPTPAGWCAAAAWERTLRKYSASRRGFCMPGGAWSWGRRRTV